MIPFIEILKGELREIDEARGIISSKETMLAELETRFVGTITNKYYYMATLLDPRFKDRFLEPVTVELAIDHIEEISATVRQEEEEQVIVEEPDSANADGQSSPTAVRRINIFILSFLICIFDVSIHSY